MFKGLDMIFDAIILTFSVIYIIVFLLTIQDITPETFFKSRETINAVVSGWIALYLLKLYWA